MKEVITIAGKITPDSGLIGLIQAHFPEQKVVIIRRDDIAPVRGTRWSDPVWGGVADFIREVD